MRRSWSVALPVVAVMASMVVPADGGAVTRRPTTTRPAPATTLRPTTTAAPAELRPLRVALPADTTNVDGDRATVGMGSPNANIYERLTRMTDDFQVRPWLAERWEFIEPNSWRFTLRPGVTFHDGTPLTSRDVAWTFDRIGRMGGRAINSAVGATKVIDDRTFEFTPARPNRKVPLQLVHPVFGIMKAGSDPVRSPIGTGPFRFVSYRQRESLVVERHADYWDAPNRAKVSGITFRYIPDPSARVLALQAGDVDLITEAPRESLADLKSRDLPIVTSPVGAYEALSIMVNGTGEFALTSNSSVRRAIAMSIDKKAIVDRVWEGNASPGRSLVPPAILGEFADDVKGGPAFDLDEARRLLDADGWRVGDGGVRSKNGRRLELTLINGFPSADIHRPIPEVLQQQLARVGIALRIVEVTDYDATLATQRGHLWLERGNQNDANPAFLPNLLYVSEEAGNRAGIDYARAFAIGGRVDRPMAEAQATADISKTQRLTAEAMKALIDDEVVIVPIAGVYNIWATTKKVSGIRPHAAQIHTNWATAVVAR